MNTILKTPRGLVAALLAAGVIGGAGAGLATAHFASAQGKAAAEMIAGHSAQTNWRAVPGATFTNPEIGSVGLSEAQAKAAGGSCVVSNRS